MLVKYNVPIKDGILVKNNGCEKKYNNIETLCINWTIASPYKLNAPEAHPIQSWLLDAFRWPENELRDDSIKRKYENTFDFLKYCKTLEVINGI